MAYKVLSARDYKLNTIKNMETGEVTETGLPKSNVLYYDLEGGCLGLCTSFRNRTKT